MTVTGCRHLTRIFICQLLLLSVEGERRLIGPSKTISGFVGHDVILPCGRELEEDLTGQGVEWTRTDLEPPYVFLYVDRKFVMDERLHQSFEGRTSISPEGLENGNLSLTITDLRLKDSGIYNCKLHWNKKTLAAKVRLAVGQVSEPQILNPVSLVDKSPLVAEAKDWYPEPEVEWRDRGGKIIFNDSSATKMNEKGYYDINSTFRGDVIPGESYSCIIRQKETSHISNTTFIVPGDADALQFSCFWVYVFVVIGYVSLVIGISGITCGYCTGVLKIQMFPKSDADMEHKRQIRCLEQEKKTLTDDICRLSKEIERLQRTESPSSTRSVSSIDSQDPLQG